MYLRWRPSCNSCLCLSQDCSFGTFWQTILRIFWHTSVGSSQPFPWDLFTRLSRFITTFFFGYLLALHRDHFINMDTISDRIVYKVALTNLTNSCSGTCLHCWTFSTLHWGSVPMSHPFSSVIFFKDYCMLLQSFFGLS